MRSVPKTVRAGLAGAVAALALAHVGLLAYVFVKRILYPYDVEWMEGGMLLHAQRILEGRPIYGPPSVEFVPFLYTPLYPALLAAIGSITGITYALGRLVSVACFAGACACAFALTRDREGTRGGTRERDALALAAVAAIAATFPKVGAWYDLIRNDSLFLLLVTGGLLVVVRRGEDARAAAAAGAILGLSFLAKQTGAFFVAAGGLGVLCVGVRPRALLRSLGAPVAFGAAALAVTVIPSLLLQRASHGWFWKWIYLAHQRHGFDRAVAWRRTPQDLYHALPGLWLTLGLALPLALSLRAARARLSRRDLPIALFAAGGALASCIGAGTQWAFVNALIPGLVLPVLLWGRVVGALPLVLAAPAAAATLGLALWKPGPHLPRDADRAAGDRLIARLRAEPGEVLIPFHPWYARLAGKRPSFHRMGLLDSVGSGYGRPRGLDDALAERRYSLVVMDYKMIRENWPLLYTAYEERWPRLQPGVDSPRTVSGADTAPLYLFVPRGGGGGERGGGGPGRAPWR